MTDWTGREILGSKILVLLEGETLVYLRDDKPEIAYPGVWDIPGGGIEGGETPRETAVRELQEETGLMVDPARLDPLTTYPAMRTGEVCIYQLRLELGEENACRFGSEGTSWHFEPLAAFLGRADAVEPLRAAVAAALSKGRGLR